MSIQIGDSTRKAVGIWLLSGGCGISSRTMAGVLLGVNPRSIKDDRNLAWNTGHPRDNSDFGRCLRFLEFIKNEEIKKSLLALMQFVSPEWKVLVDHWGEFETLYNDESGKSELYKRMREIGL